MAWPNRAVWQIRLALLSWTVLLALLPWWLGLPLLLALAVALWLLQHRLTDEHGALMRSALRWGLAGVLWSLQRGLGGDAFAWGAALLGALVGYTLLAGLEAWLDRDLRRASAEDHSAENGGPEWSELAMAPIGPSGSIIELQLPQWRPASDLSPDLQAGIEYRDDQYVFDHRSIDDVDSRLGIDAQPAGWRCACAMIAASSCSIDHAGSCIVCADGSSSAGTMDNPGCRGAKGTCPSRSPRFVAMKIAEPAGFDVGAGNCRHRNCVAVHHCIIRSAL